MGKLHLIGFEICSVHGSSKDTVAEAEVVVRWWFNERNERTEERLDLTCGHAARIFGLPPKPLRNQKQKSRVIQEPRMSKR